MKGSNFVSLSVSGSTHKIKGSANKTDTGLTVSVPSLCFMPIVSFGEGSVRFGPFDSK